MAFIDFKYCEKPDEFYSVCFVDENKEKLNTSAHLPLGIVPRICIGNRCALLETTVMIFYLLASCELKSCAKTCHPLKLSKKISF